MNRMEALVERRREARREVASACLASILLAARERGVQITPVGSVARNDFQSHSDIDLLVRGPIDPRRRLLVERLVADEMRGADIPYDLIFEADMTEDRVRELFNDCV